MDYNGLLSNPLLNIGLGLLSTKGNASGLQTGLLNAQKSAYQQKLMEQIQNNMNAQKAQQEQQAAQQDARMRMASLMNAQQVPGSGPLNANPQPAYAVDPTQQQLMQDLMTGYPGIGEAMMQQRFIPEQADLPPEIQYYEYGLMNPDFNAQRLAAKRAGATNISNIMGGPLTPGQEKLDEEYAKQLAGFEAGGGFSDTEKMIGQLEEVYNALGDKSKNLTGPIIGQTPDLVLSVVNPEAMAARDTVEEVVQRNLREILGAQFTEREGERLIARAYNPKLGEEENRKRVRRLIDQIRDAYEAKRSAADYFRKNGTIKGWEGALPTIGDFYEAIDAEEPSIDDLLKKYGG